MPLSLLNQWLRSSVLRVLSVGACVTSLLWLWRSRVPDTWPEPADGWTDVVSASVPGSVLVDHVERGVPVADTSVPSLLVLGLIAVCTYASGRRVGLPRPVAWATAVGLPFSRVLWSTAVPGADATPALAVAVALSLSFMAVREWVRVLACALVVVMAPAAAWLVIPAAVVWPETRRRRIVAVLFIAACALATSVATAILAWRGTTCLTSSASWQAALTASLAPGVLDGGIALASLNALHRVLAADLHVFGLLTAAIGGALLSPRVRLASGVALVATLGGVFSGGLLPSTALALVMPWWSVWFGRGLVAVLTVASVQRPVPSMVVLLVMTLVVPVARHMSVDPSPWVSGAPRVVEAIASPLSSSIVVSDQRRMRRLLGPDVRGSLPLERGAVQECLAAGTSVVAIGQAAAHLETLSLVVAPEPRWLPLTQLLEDTRPTSLVALALTAGAAPWAGQAVRTSFQRLGIAPPPPATDAIAAIATARAAGASDHGRPNAAVGLDTQSLATLQEPIHAAVEGEVATIGRRIPLVTSRTGAIVVFDRAGEAVLSSPVARAPGAPVWIGTVPDWRVARVVSVGGACQSLGTDGPHVRTSAERLAVPMSGTTSARPLVAYAWSHQRPSPTLYADQAQWHAEVFDSAAPADLAALTDTTRQDGLTLPVSTARWVVRLQVSAVRRGSRARAILIAGTQANWTILPHDGLNDRQVCETTAGPRVLAGQRRPIDDLAPSALKVRLREGWHAPEGPGPDAHQWTGRETATASVVVGNPAPLTLHIDGHAADDRPVAIEWNGQLVARWPGGPAIIAVPASVVRPGDNRLALVAHSLVRPPGDARDLGVLVQRLRVVQADR